MIKVAVIDVSRARYYNTPCKIIIAPVWEVVYSVIPTTESCQQQLHDNRPGRLYRVDSFTSIVCILTRSIVERLNGIRATRIVPSPWKKHFGPDLLSI